MSNERIRFAIEEGVAVLHMDDGKVNAIDADFVNAMDAALDRVEEDEGARAVVLAGREGCFSAGLNTRKLPSLSPDVLRATLIRFGEGLVRLFLFPRPVVAAVTGHAIAGGAMLALSADLRVAANGPFRIGLNEVPLGVTLPGYAVDMARLALPAHRLSEAILHGKLYEPHKAREIGYVTEVVVPPDRTVARAIEIAKELATLPAQAYEQTKERVRGLAVAESRARIDAEVDRFTADFMGAFGAS